jgi:hypothetical protein
LYLGDYPGIRLAGQTAIKDKSGQIGIFGRRTMRTMLRQDTSGDSRAESKEPALRTSGQAGRPSFVRVNPFVPQGEPALRKPDLREGAQGEFLRNSRKAGPSICDQSLKRQLSWYWQAIRATRPRCPTSEGGGWFIALGLPCGCAWGALKYSTGTGFSNAFGRGANGSGVGGRRIE